MIELATINRYVGGIMNISPYMHLPRVPSPPCCNHRMPLSEAPARLWMLWRSSSVRLMLSLSAYECKR